VAPSLLMLPCHTQRSARVRALDNTERRTCYIGLLSQSLVFVGACLDFACVEALQEPGGKDKFKELPQSMKGKLRLLRSAFTNSDQLAAARQPALDLLDCIAEVSHFRNLTVHALAVKDLGEAGTALLRRVKHLPDVIRPQYQAVGLQDGVHANYEGGALQMAAPVILFHILQVERRAHMTHQTPWMPTRTCAHPRPSARKGSLRQSGTCCLPLGPAARRTGPAARLPAALWRGRGWDGFARWSLPARRGVARSAAHAPARRPPRLIAFRHSVKPPPRWRPSPFSATSRGKRRPLSPAGTPPTRRRSPDASATARAAPR
jgi:hypothetical protein